MKNEVLKLGLILGIISCVASGTLAMVNNITEPIIAQQEIAANDLARKELLPNADSFEPVEVQTSESENVIEVFKAVKGSDSIGFIIKTATKGYNGRFDVVTGVDSEGKISGVKLANINETPGLGAKAEDAKFINQYVSIPANIDPTVSKSPSGSEGEIIAISGATITSNAVTKGVNEALDYYENHLKK